MNLFQYCLLILFFEVTFSLNGTGQTNKDCFELKVLNPTEIIPVTPLPIVRANDVLWQRRLWREIDLTEKINQLLYFPNEKEDRNCSLYDILYHYLQQGVLKAYDSKDDSFTKELSLNELLKSLGDSVYNENKQLIYQPIDSRTVVKYWLKEDWFYNANYSKIEVRIIGICPVKIKLDKDGNVMGYQQLFWLYFPHIRSVLTNFEAFKKEKEDDPRVSFDDIFIHRMFNSYIIQKEEGEMQHVRENKTELDIQLENEKTRLYYYKREIGLWGN